MSTTTTSTTTTTHTCPYASTLPPSKEAASSSSSPAEALALAKTSCPAFKKSCPFKDAKNSLDVKKTMLSIPPTHRVDEHDSKEKEGGIGKQVKMALEHMHHVSLSLQQQQQKSPPSKTKIIAAGHVKEKKVALEEERNKYVLEGGCPFKTYYQGEGKGEPFVNVMENLSLSAIMSRMASDLEEDERELLKEQDHDDDAPKKENEVTLVEIKATSEKIASLPSSTINTTSLSLSSKNKRPSLSLALKTGTSTSHASAENVHFVRNFIRGKIEKDLYIRLISSLYFIYKTLEEELNKYAPKYFPTLHFPNELERVESLCDDLDYYHGESHLLEAQRVYKESRATRDYCERIKYIAQSNPLLLLSHGYTRYLGDLSGGRILARVARKALHLSSDGDGLRFYQFENVKNPKQFKDGYRKALDELNLSEEEVERVVGEANVAFALNVRVFEELDVIDGCLDEVMELKEATGYLDRVLEEQERRREVGGDVVTIEGKRVKGDDDDAAAKCPFAFMGGPNPHGEKELTKDKTETKVTNTKSAANFATTIQKETTEPPKGKCPWPFILLHDFQTGMQDYRSKIVVGIVLCWAWSCFVQSDLYRQIFVADK